MPKGHLPHFSTSWQVTTRTAQDWGWSSFERCPAISFLQPPWIPFPLPYFMSDSYHFLFPVHFSNRYQSQNVARFFSQGPTYLLPNCSHWPGDEMFQFVVPHATSSQDTITQKKWKLIPESQADRMHLCTLECGQSSRVRIVFSRSPSQK